MGFRGPLPFLFVAACAPLLGCATPDELAVAQKRREREVQTGTNIVRPDGASRTSVATDQKSKDDLLNDLRSVPAQTQVPQGTGR